VKLSHPKSMKHFAGPEVLLTGAFVLYAAFNLFSMAAMSISASVLLVAIFYNTRKKTQASAPGFWVELKRVVTQGPGRLFFRASVALTFALGISLAAAVFVPSLYEGNALHIQFLRTMSKVWYLFWPLLLVVGLKKLGDKNRKIVLQVWIVVSILLSATGVLQYFTGWPRPQPIPGNEPFFHTTLFLGHHLSVASILIFPFFALMDLAWKPARFLSRWITIPGIGLGLLALLGTYSRTLWVALPVGLLLWSFFNLPRKGAIAAAVLVIMGSGLALQHPQIYNRVHASMGIGDRQALWLANFQFFKDRPLTGTGWRQNEEASGYYLAARAQPGTPVFAGHAHSNLLDLLGGTGALGTVSWLAWWWVVFATLGQTRRRPGELKFPIGLLCAFIVFHINGFTQVNFWEGKVQHQLAWVIAWILFWASNQESGKSHES